MNCYLTKLVYQITTCDPCQSLFDIQWRIIVAENGLTALAKSKRIGKQSEYSLYDNNGTALVQWIFINIMEVQCLCTKEDRDDLHIHSEKISIEEIDKYIYQINDNAIRLAKTLENC